MPYRFKDTAVFQIANLCRSLIGEPAVVGMRGRTHGVGLPGDLWVGGAMLVVGLVGETVSHVGVQRGTAMRS